MDMERRTLNKIFCDGCGKDITDSNAFAEVTSNTFFGGKHTANTFALCPECHGRAVEIMSYALRRAIAKEKPHG